MATAEIMAVNPVAGSWIKVNGTPRYEPGAKTAEAAEVRRQELLAEAEAKETEAETKRQERQSAINAEAIAQAIAKAAATPNATKFLAFLKLIKYKDTCPLFAEIRAEMDRLQAEAEADAAERGEEG